MTQRADSIFRALGDALPGTLLAGRYKLLSRIGVGGFAIVFRGTDIRRDRTVAVKIFRPRAGNDSAVALERFRHEGVATSRIRHPHIVEVLDTGITEEGIPFIAMELLVGRPLHAELVSGGRVPLPRIARWMSQVCAGLAAAHAIGIVHRDIKPENIFIHGNGEDEIAKLLDFGVAKILDSERLARVQLTASGELLGSPRYMAPERMLGRESGPKADVYSVGVILYEALAGRPPFVGTIGEVMTQAVSTAPAAIANHAADLPRPLAALIMATLARQAADRPGAAEVAASLAVYAGQASAPEKQT
jgi:serine/threonine protein kinase